MQHEYRSCGLPKKKEIEYVNFFRSIILFLTRAMDVLFIDEIIPKKTRYNMEFKIVTTISLLCNMHISIFSEKALHPRLSHTVAAIQTFDKKQSRDMLPLIHQLQNKIDKYTFLNNPYKNQCEKMLEYVLQYYIENNEKGVGIVYPVPPPPWMAYPSLGNIRK